MDDSKIKEIVKCYKAKKKAEDLPFYKLRSILGNDWAIYYFLVGSRMTGKSYAVTQFYVHQFVKYKRPFYWLRLTEASTRKLLANGAEKLVDPDLKRKYGLNLSTKGENVYHTDKHGNKILMCKVLSLSTFYSDKGQGFFDKEFIKQPKAYYNICLDEMNREQSEKNAFDIIYNFANEIENIIRNTKHNIRIICIGNTLSEASDLLTAINFLPDKPGRFYLVKHKKKLYEMIHELKHAKDDHEIQYIHEKYKSYDFGKRAVVEYMENTEAYKAMRNGSAAAILAGESSTFTNETPVDTSILARHTRFIKPTAIIKFRKDKSTWFTVWDGKYIAPYNGQTATVYAMRPYLDEFFNADLQKNIINLFDSRSFLFRDLKTFKTYQREMQLLKPRK